MNHLSTARRTTAAVPLLALLFIGGSSPHAEDALAGGRLGEPAPVVQCQATAPAPQPGNSSRLAMFGPPPTGRPAISTQRVQQELMQQMPSLPGPHANASKQSDLDPDSDEMVFDVQDLGSSNSDDREGDRTAVEQRQSEYPRLDTSTVVEEASPVKDATIQDVWGQIIHTDPPAGENGSEPTPNDLEPFSITEINRPSDTVWGQSNTELHEDADLETAVPTDVAASPQPPAIAVEQVAPWLDRNRYLPGPNAAKKPPETPALPQSVVLPAEPRVAEQSEPFREPPAVPLQAPDDDLLTNQVVPPVEPNLGGRSRELEIVARNADILSQGAFELAGKRAYFSARTEFIKSLRLLTEALDAQYGTQSHGFALAAGLQALKESDEFIPRGSNLEADINVPLIASGHSTPVLNDLNDPSISPLEARQLYYTYAQEQLAFSIRDEFAGSIALYGLGKLHTVMGDQGAATIPAAETKAVVFHQAALMAVPQNAMAANEVGVLLAQMGRLEASREALLHSLRVAPMPDTWHNLSVVHARLGEHELARMAQGEHVNAKQLAMARRGNPEAGESISNLPVQLVAPEILAQASAHESLARVPDEDRSEPTPVTSESESVGETHWWSRLPLINRK